MPNKSTERQNSYTFSPYLKEYLDETLALQKIKNDHAVNSSRIGVHDKRKIRNNDFKKVGNLDRHIFRSMANLIYFFEFINKHPELINKFGDDIEELFGLRSNRSGRFYTFYRFIYAIEGYDDPKNDFDNRFHFRRRLIEIMQSCINAKVEDLALKDKSWSPANHNIKTMIRQDMSRAEVWTNFFDKLTGRENKKSRRLIGF